MSKKTAIALSYPAGADAPFIVAKGKGNYAERILEIAEENSVYIVKDDLTADILSLYEIGDYIPPETYEVIAGVFAFLLRMRDEQN
ncbi:MAG: EscU/YscU/HrcU family type III secretion system export apparatus switch protein [Treponemataceae bacterium]|nr:EscU/YscU/HrcU family type III secretion system export apparatus switch protein [Treponemataceae bacterium]